MKKGNSLISMKKNNKALIKNLIYRTENATRIGISKNLELTLPTITSTVNELLADDILVEIGINEKTSGGGRRANIISFNKEYAYIIGIELGPYASYIVLMDILGNVVESIEIAIAKEIYADMLADIEKIVTGLKLKYKEKKILGLGIGLPGFIEWKKGIIRSNHREDWNGKNLVQDLEKLISLPVLIDNNVRLRALAYEMNNSKVDTFAYFYVSRAIACPLVIKSDIVSGFSYGAGELGRFVINVDREHKILDDLAGEKAILNKLKQGSKVREVKDLLKYQDTDEDVRQAINEAIFYMSLGMANVVNLINPHSVVVDAYLMQKEGNRDLLKKFAKENFYGINEDDVDISFKDYDFLWGAKSAAYFVIKRLLLDR